MDLSQVQVAYEGIKLFQVQLVVTDASLELILAKVAISCFPKQALGSFAVNRRSAISLYPHGEIQLRLFKLRFSCALAQAFASYRFVDVPDVAPFDESGCSYSSHGILLSAAGRPLRDLY